MSTIVELIKKNGNYPVGKKVSVKNPDEMIKKGLAKLPVVKAKAKKAVKKVKETPKSDK